MVRSMSTYSTPSILYIIDRVRYSCHRNQDQSVPQNTKCFQLIEQLSSPNALKRSSMTAPYRKTLIREIPQNFDHIRV